MRSKIPPRGLTCHLLPQKFGQTAENWGLEMDLVIQIFDTCVYNERGFCILVCFEKKPLSFFGNLFYVSWDMDFQNMFQIGNSEI